MDQFFQRLVNGATLLAGAAAFVAIGYSLGKDTNEGTLSFVREKYQALEKSEARLTGENTSLKLELQNARVAPTSEPRMSGAATGNASATGTIASVPKATPNVEKVSLQRGQSAEVFAGQLNIALITIPFEGEPLRHRVVASIGSVGKETKTLDKVDVGYALKYGDYEVRVLSAETFTVVFQVSKL
jgi:hypothetical protein